MWGAEILGIIDLMTLTPTPAEKKTGELRKNLAQQDIASSRKYRYTRYVLMSRKNTTTPKGKLFPTPSTRRLNHRPWWFLFLLLLVIPQIALANNSQPETIVSLPVMPTITVEASRIAPTTGMTIIDKETIKNLPIRNGSVNEIIGTVPGAQYSEQYLSSFQSGEITPPVISISGSRFYDNNYTIDGLSNNSPLDPASNEVSGATKLPGHPQIHFLSPQLIEDITVYDSNIPAEFGGFSGGQIDTRTIVPTSDFWGKIHYRTTGDNWTRFHIDPADDDVFYSSNSTGYQPRFRKHDFGFIINTPLNDDTNLVSSYQQLSSKIPLYHLGQSKDQRRKHENFFLKLQHFLPDNSQLSVTVLFSPTATDYFNKEKKNSDYNLDSNNYSLMLKYEKEFFSGQFKMNFGYTNQKTERQTVPNRFFWDTETASIDWNGGREGNLGEIETGQRALNLNTDFSFHSFNLQHTNHQIKAGATVSHSKQYYKRPTTNYLYYSPETAVDTVCDPDDPACISGEQYLKRRTVYQQADSHAELFDYAAYLQDSISWKQFEIFPGVRISSGNYTHNVNLAPRLSVSIDVFDNRNTILFGGINRYYSGTMLTHTLYSSIVTINQNRNSTTAEWSGTSKSYYAKSSIKTPYTDEKTIGVIQQLFGGETKVQYIEKKSYDEFSRHREETDMGRVYILNNYGRSTHESAKISWQRFWKNHFLEINGTWQETTTSNSDYSSNIDSEDRFETIWYQGKELSFDEIPRTDFSRPVVANLVYSCELPHGFKLTNITKYRGAYQRLWRARDADNHLLKRQSIRNPDQGKVYVYKRVKTHDAFTFDWHISWEIPIRSKQDLLLSIDILNLFNRKIEYGYQTGNYGYDYEIGRQFWAGVEYSF